MAAQFNHIPDSTLCARASTGKSSAVILFLNIFPTNAHQTTIIPKNVRTFPLDSCSRRKTKILYYSGWSLSALYAKVTGLQLSNAQSIHCCHFSVFFSLPFSVVLCRSLPFSAELYRSLPFSLVKRWPSKSTDFLRRICGVCAQLLSCFQVAKVHFKQTDGLTVHARSSRMRPPTMATIDDMRERAMGLHYVCVCACMHCAHVRAVICQFCNEIITTCVSSVWRPMFVYIIIIISRLCITIIITKAHVCVRHFGLEIFICYEQIIFLLLRRRKNACDRQLYARRSTRMCAINSQTKKIVFSTV